MISTVLGIRGVLAGWDLYQSKKRRPNNFNDVHLWKRLRHSDTVFHKFSHYTSQYKFCSTCRRLTAIPMPSYDPHFDPLFGGRGVRAEQGVENGCQSIVPHSYSTSILAYLAPFGHNTQRGRQIDRQTDDGNRPHMLL